MSAGIFDYHNRRRLFVLKMHHFIAVFVIRCSTCIGKTIVNAVVAYNFAYVVGKGLFVWSFGDRLGLGWSALRVWIWYTNVWEAMNGATTLPKTKSKLAQRMAHAQLALGALLFFCFVIAVCWCMCWFGVVVLSAWLTSCCWFVVCVALKRRWRSGDVYDTNQSSRLLICVCYDVV